MVWLGMVGKRNPQAQTQQDLATLSMFSGLMAEVIETEDLDFERVQGAKAVVFSDLSGREFTVSGESIRDDYYALCEWRGIAPNIPKTRLI